MHFKLVIFYRFQANAEKAAREYLTKDEEKRKKVGG